MSSSEVSRGSTGSRASKRAACNEPSESEVDEEEDDELDDLEPLFGADGDAFADDGEQQQGSSEVSPRSTSSRTSKQARSGAGAESW